MTERRTINNVFNTLSGQLSQQSRFLRTFAVQWRQRAHLTANCAPAPAVDNNYQAGNSNQNMGGDNFGINDSSSWDDGGGDMGGGGGDWDS